ncbi:MAG TPA: hypothetical protein VNS80_03070 [Pseudolysinimonas sp.]|nr:hypothetical protein [Pseudolysinimonas sp.]
MGFFDDLADGLSGLIFDAKIEDGVRGTAQVVSASGYYGHALYQSCQLEVVVEGPGIPATAATVQAVVSRDTWPQAGQVLPALIERANPREVQILWDELPKTGDVAKAQAEALAAAKRGEAPAPGTPFGPGTTVKVVGDVSQVTPEQREKLKAMGIDLDAILGGPTVP